jgi:hypothetical protein
LLSRGRTAKEISKIGREKWKNLHNFLKRWTVEISFLDFMGEFVKARRTYYMI